MQCRCRDREFAGREHDRALGPAQRPGHQADAALTKSLQDHVKATIAPYKYPRAIEYLSELPKTQTGKLQRFELRKAAAAQSAQKLAS